MGKQKCDYCGREVESDYMSSLENGSPACIDCVREENKAGKEN